MKRYISILISVLILFLFLTGCGLQPTQVDPKLLYTQAAKTVFVQMTKVAVLTPSITPTFTPAPTGTITPTPIPSPTVPQPTPTWVSVEAGKVTAPIFLYYHIAASAQEDPFYQWESPYYIPPSLFKTQMEVLSHAGYSSVTVSQLTDAVRKGGSFPAHPFVITFEANTQSVFTIAYPIMKQYGYVGTVYTIFNQIDQAGMLTTSQIKTLMAAGWEFGSKGMTGVDVLKNHEQAGYEIATSRTELGKKLGVDIKTYSYSNGQADDIINGVRIQGWGYQSAVGVGRSSDITSDNLFFLPRYEMRKDLKIEDYAAMLPAAPTWIPTFTTAPTLTRTVTPAVK